jgi:hypothetical protein
MSSGNTVVPDLLRRFVRAPHVFSIDAGDICGRVETNDPSIVEAMRSVTAPLSHEGPEQAYFWKLIRDEAAPRGGREVTILSFGPLSTVLLGVGTMIAIDRERREVLGFIAPDVPTEQFVESWLPLITKLLVTAESNEPQ